MKQKAFFLKSLMVIGFIGWSMSSFAQAKDCENVYLDGHVLEFVDPATFHLKGHSKPHYREPKEYRNYDRHHAGYYKSNFDVYYGDKKIDATAATFKEIGEGYAKDSFSVFYHGRKMDASAATFKLLEGGYAKDAFNVFYYGNKIDGASPATFKYTGEGYAEDAFNVYYRGRKLE